MPTDSEMNEGIFSLDPYLKDPDDPESGWEFGDASSDEYTPGLEAFSGWVEEGPQDWTQDEWAAWGQLSTDSDYSDPTADYRTVQDEFEELAESKGVDAETYALYSHDPRMWELLQGLPDAGISSLDPFGEQASRFFGFTEGLGRKSERGASDLQYDESGTGDYGPWSYVAPDPDPVFGSADEDQAVLAHVREQYDGSPATWHRLDQAQSIVLIRQQLRGMGADPEEIEGLFKRISDGALLSEDQAVIDFLSYQPTGGGVPSHEDVQAFNRLIEGTDYVTQMYNPYAHVVPDLTDLNESGEINVQDYTLYLSNQGGPGGGTVDPLETSFLEAFPRGDFWTYSRQYIDWLPTKYTDPETGEFLWTTEYEAEVQEAREKLGQPREGAPPERFVPGETVVPDAEPWIQGGEFDPVQVGGTGPFGIGIAKPPFSDDPTPTPWGLDFTPYDYGGLSDLSEEDKNSFAAAEEFFTFVREDAIERGAVDANGEVNMTAYWQTLKRDEQPSYVDDMENYYNYYGAEWERISPEYYAAVQAESKKYLGTEQHGKDVEGLKKALLPHANEVLTMFNSATGQNYTLEQMVGFLSGTSTIDYPGVDESSTPTPPVPTGGGVANVGSGSTATTGAGQAPDATSAVGNATNSSVEPTSTATTNNVSPPVNGTTFTNLYVPPDGSAPSSQNSRGLSIDGLATESYASSYYGELTGRPSDQISLPNFVVDRLPDGGPVDPVAYWMSLSANEQADFTRLAESMGLDTKTNNYDNPESDLYRTSGNTTTFYMPTWAVEIAQTELGGYGTIRSGEYDGIIPTYDWWQKIGTRRRLNLQKEADLNGDNTKLIGVRKMEQKNVGGRNVGFVSEAKSFSANDKGGYDPIWSTEEADETVRITVPEGPEPVSLTDFIKYSIDKSGGFLDPLGIFDETAPYRTRAAVGLESVVPGGGHPYARSAMNYIDHTMRNPNDRYAPTASFALNPDGYQIGSYGGISATAWNYLLEHLDAWLGEGNENKIPLPSGVSEEELKSVKNDEGIVHYGDLVEKFYYKYTQGGFLRAGSKKRAPGTYTAIGTKGYDYVVDEDDPRNVDYRLPSYGSDDIRDFSDLGRSSFGSVDLDMDEFMSKLSSAVFIDGTGASTLSDLVEDYDSGWAPAYNASPLWVDGGFSGQAMWGALSLFLPSYEQYLQSYDKAYADKRPPSFDAFMESGRIEKRPEIDPYNLGQSAAQSLAYQQNSLVSYGDWLADRSVSVDWSGGVVVPVSEYEGMGGGGYHANPYYALNLSDKIEAPIRLGDELVEGGGNAAGGLIGLGYQGGGGVSQFGNMPPDPSAGIQSLGAQPEISGIEQMVQQDPFLQEVVKALSGFHPDPDRIIQVAIDRYGEELIMKLARIIQPADGGRGSYVPGSTGGLADVVPAVVDGAEPAKLSSGEFVVPADVVAHLGDGNNENGAQKLHGMMDRVRVDKTGSEVQPGTIAEEEVLPA